MKRAPSVLLPASAKNMSPVFTARLSTAKPVTGNAPAWPSITISSQKISRSLMVFQFGREFACILTATGGTQRTQTAFQAGCKVPTSRLLSRPRCRKNKAVGRRQVETRLYPQQRRDALNYLATGWHRVPARGD